MSLSENDGGSRRPEIERHELAQPDLREPSTAAPDGLALSLRYRLERALLEEFRDADYETGLGWEAVVHTVVAHLEDAEGQHLVQARAAIFVNIFVEWVRRLLWAHDPESRAALLQLLDDDAITHEADRIQGWYVDEN